MDDINEYSFERESTKDEFLEEAINKKYSTFELYNDEEFEKSLKSFKNCLNGKKDINYTAEIGEVIFRKL